VDADGGEQEGDQGEPGKHPDLHRSRGSFGVDDVGHPPDVRDGLERIDAADDLADRRDELFGRRRRTNHEILRRIERHPAVVNLPIGQVHLRLAVALETAHAHVANHADDRSLLEGNLEPAAERILPWPVARGERFADHRDGLRGESVGVEDVTSGTHRDAKAGK